MIRLFVTLCIIISISCRRNRGENRTIKLEKKEIVLIDSNKLKVNNCLLEVDTILLKQFEIDIVDAIKAKNKHLYKFSV